MHAKQANYFKLKVNIIAQWSSPTQILLDYVQLNLVPNFMGLGMQLLTVPNRTHIRFNAI